MRAKMNDEQCLIPKGFLQSGQSLPITKTISFKHPTVQDIWDLDKSHFGLHSEEMYYSMINIFLTDPYQYMVYLDDKGLDYEKVTPFQLFVMLFEDRLKMYSNYLKAHPDEDINGSLVNDIYFRSFKFFMDVDSFAVVAMDDDSKVIVYDNEVIINEYNFDYIYDFVKSVNGIPDIERIYPEDEWAKQILIEDERERLKKLKLKKDKVNEEDKNIDRLGNLLSSITWTCNGGVTPFNRNQLHMYDLIDGIHRTDKLLNYKNIMVGLYSGCLDKKKIKFKELHWSN